MVNPGPGHGLTVSDERTGPNAPTTLRPYDPTTPRPYDPTGSQPLLTVLVSPLHVILLRLPGAMFDMATKPQGKTSIDVSTDQRWTRETLTTERWDGLQPAMRHPDDVDHDDGYWTTTDNHQLYWQSWCDESAPDRATVGLMHGYGEHSSRYHHVATALARVGYNVVAIDARGHGRSTGRRGHVRRYSRYVDDLAMLKRQALERWPENPLFLFGHSNGGLITLRYALRKPDGIDGFVVTSPMCRLAVRVSPVKSLAGRLTSRLIPTLSLPSDLDPADVSHIDEVVEKYREDPLVFDTANARWFTEAQSAMTDVQHRADALDQPFLFLVAGDDRIVDPGATETLFHNLGSFDRELEVFPDLYHEVLNEHSWKAILRRIVLWMERRREPDTT